MENKASIVETINSRAREILALLVAFDTTSRNSNIELISWVENYLAEHDITSRRVSNADGGKANLYATIGPMVEGGIILSGHSDVVPVDGQNWSSDPFIVQERGDKIFGRGTSDMKGFIALALAAVPYFLKAARPVHLAISYDEEIGCLGAPALIAEIADKLPRPALAIVGEPTMMKVINGHKGIAVYSVDIYGHEAHSSLTHLGASANMIAIELMAELSDIARDLQSQADETSPFIPPHATLTVGKIQGGTAVNILARHCNFEFDLRCPPGQSAATIIQPIKEKIEILHAELKAQFPEASMSIKQLADAPPMAPTANEKIEAFVRSLTGDNHPSGVVSYAAEAGQFQQAGFPTVICGPGSIEQAHQPDEFMSLEQFARGAEFMARLSETLAP